MKKVKIVSKNEITFSELLDLLKSSKEIYKCGAIVSFIGIVRGVGKNGKDVIKLVYEAEKEVAERVLEEIRKDILSKYPELKELIIYHVVDELGVSEPTIFILGAAEHRDQAFKGVREALERVKKEVPIWKKEVTVEGEHWIAGEEIVKN